MVTDYHFHLYFTPETRDSAAALREAVAAQRDFAIEVSTLREGPVGPHPLPQFWGTVQPDAFEPAVRWYLTHHGEHSVLIHPSTGDDLRDHTRHAMWLGPPLRLDLARLS